MFVNPSSRRWGQAGPSGLLANLAYSVSYRSVRDLVSKNSDEWPLRNSSQGSPLAYIHTYTRTYACTHTHARTYRKQNSFSNSSKVPWETHSFTWHLTPALIERLPWCSLGCLANNSLVSVKAKWLIPIHFPFNPRTKQVPFSPSGGP